MFIVLIPLRPSHSRSHFHSFTHNLLSMFFRGHTQRYSNRVDCGFYYECDSHSPSCDGYRLATQYHPSNDTSQTRRLSNPRPFSIDSNLSCSLYIYAQTLKFALWFVRFFQSTKSLFEFIAN
jgi:hypothetical protein